MISIRIQSFQVNFPYFELFPERIDSETAGSSSEEVLPIKQSLKGCLYNEAKFSKGMSYYTLDCKGPGIPKTLLFETKTNKQIAVLSSNSGLQKTVFNVSLPIVRRFNVPLPTSTYGLNEFSTTYLDSDMGDGSEYNMEGFPLYNASVRLFLPPDITVKTFRTYPLVVQV